MSDFAQKMLLKDERVVLYKRFGLAGAAERLKTTEDELALDIERARWELDGEYFSGQRLKIVDKSGMMTPLRFNESQRKLNRVVERQRAEGKPVRICLLKARQWGGCLEPDTPILTADLRWIRISDVCVGDELVACDESPAGSSRKMRTCKVEKIWHTRKPAYRITLDDNVSVICSAGHRWLSKKDYQTQCSWGSIGGGLRTGDQIRSIADVWGESSLNDAWLGGIIDGEGSLNRKKSGGTTVAIAQCAGVVFDRMNQVCSDRSYGHYIVNDNTPIRTSKFGSKPVGVIYIGTMRNLFRLMGLSRPTRFIGACWWEGKRMSDNGWRKIVAIELVGEMGLVDIQTSTGTFVAKGLVSHNSTYIESEIFRDSVLRSLRSSMIVAHDLESARHLREMSERYYDYYDLEKPRLKKESDKWWKYRHEVRKRPADSHVRIDTADELSGGHSFTIHNLHLSEVALWRDPKELIKGLFPTVPNSADTMIFLESTGRGIGDWWYDFCQDSILGRNGFEFVFVPWYEIEDYQRTIEGKFELDEYEQALFDKGVSPEKLYWRRKKIEDEFGSDTDSFGQQYPSSPEEAFIASGSPVFPQRRIYARIMASKPPAAIGDLVMTIKDGKERVDFSENKKGYWKLWEKPEDKRNLYALGADVAEGLAHGDYSVAPVIRRDTGRAVAEFHAHVDPDIFATELHKAWRYWGCRVGVERNNHGRAVIELIKDIPGLDLYRTPQFLKKFDDKKEEYGWETTARTKGILIDELLSWIRENELKSDNEDFWKECLWFVRDERGRMGAQQGKHDDRVIAMAIALQVSKDMPPIWAEVKEEKVVRTRDMDLPMGETLTQKAVMENTYAEW